MALVHDNDLEFLVKEVRSSHTPWCYHSNTGFRISLSKLDSQMLYWNTFGIPLQRYDGSSVVSIQNHHHLGPDSIKFT